jgi:hypothetical protein
MLHQSTSKSIACHILIPRAPTTRRTAGDALTPNTKASRPTTILISSFSTATHYPGRRSDPRAIVPTELRVLGTSLSSTMPVYPLSHAPQPWRCLSLILPRAGIIRVVKSLCRERYVVY